MKPLSIIIVAFSLFIFAGVQAQENKKYAADPSYSVHNYKHPNKATLAKQRESNAVQTQFIIVQEVIPSLADSRRNYKKHRQTKPSLAKWQADAKNTSVKSSNTSLLQH